MEIHASSRFGAAYKRITNQPEESNFVLPIKTTSSCAYARRIYTSLGLGASA
jgi:hypothetical protein